jgi:hypothetical protein
MIPSDQQKAAINHGLGDGESWWKPVEVPEGPQEIPDWCSDLAVEWHDGYGNSPSFKLKTRENPYAFAECPSPVWVKHGSLYGARHPDGRGLFHHHSGPVSEQWLPVGVGCVPNSIDDSQAMMWEFDCNDRSQWNNGWTVSEWVRATTRQEGYGGRRFRLMMEDGKPLVLCGPWHGSSPNGYVHASVYDTSNETTRRYEKSWEKSNTPWWARGGTFGLFITEDLFKRLFARFQPHLTLALVHEGRSMAQASSGSSPLLTLRSQTGARHEREVDQRDHQSNRETPGGEHGQV